MEMAYHQTRFFPFRDGAPSIHSLRVNPSKTHVLVTTDRNVQELRCDGASHDYKLQEIAFLDEPSASVDVIASGVIECPGRDRVVVAYAELQDDDDVGESTTGECTDKLFLSVIDPRAARTKAAAVGATTTTTSASKETAKPKAKTKTSAQGSAAADPSTSTIRFELVAAPTTITSVRAHSLGLGGSSSEFNGVILFRMESMVAIGFVDDADGKNEPSAQCVRLTNEQFAAFFPEFAQFDHPVLTVDVQILRSQERGWVAMGCADGIIRVFAGSLMDGVLSGPYEVRDLRVDGPVMSVSLFTSTREGHQVLNLVAACAIGRAVIFEDIFSSSSGEARRKETLVGSDQYDSIFSVLAVDIDLDGETELLVGTDDQALLAYKRDSSPPTAEPSLKTKRVGDVASPPTSTSEPLQVPRWSQLPLTQWQMRAFGGIYSLASLDLNRDGVQELIIASSTGVYVYEADSAVVLRELEAMVEAAALEDTQP